jgi:hypothetical protein
MADCHTDSTAKAAARRAVAQKAALRATAASAKLENREIPADHVRSAGVQRLLAERQTAQTKRSEARARRDCQ